MPSDSPSTAALDERSLYLRRLAMRGILGPNRGHVGATLSLMEMVRVLYDSILRYRPDDPAWPERDRFILSKGHGCLAQYALLAEKGFFSVEALDDAFGLDSFLGGHPERGPIPGVEASTGALGHGLPIGLGMARAARLRGAAWRVFVMAGDGEMDEGSMWEAAMAAGRDGLENLTLLIDYNHIQSYGPVDAVQPLEPLAAKLESFGFAVAEVDGHDVAALESALGGVPFTAGRPSALVAHTIKGRGLPDAENDPTWHHKARFSDEQRAAMLAALGGT